jgi:hypothetical protein
LLISKGNPRRTAAWTDLRQMQAIETGFQGLKIKALREGGPQRILGIWQGRMPVILGSGFRRLAPHFREIANPMPNSYPALQVQTLT